MEPTDSTALLGFTRWQGLTEPQDVPPMLVHTLELQHPRRGRSTGRHVCMHPLEGIPKRLASKGLAKADRDG